jgi:hypothetical protein
VLPVFGQDHAPIEKMHDPEKWYRFSGKIMRQLKRSMIPKSGVPVFGQDHAPIKKMHDAGK